MPLINLIEEQRLGSKQQDRRSRGLFLTFVGITVASLGTFGYLFLETEKLQTEEARLKKQSDILSPIVDQIEKNNILLSEMGPKLATLETAQEATLRWSRILDHLSKNMPQGVWLTNVRCVTNDKTKPVSMTVTGISASQESVGELITRLSLCSDLENVALKYTQEKLLERTKGIEYEISAEVAGTAEKAAVKDEEKPKA